MCNFEYGNLLASAVITVHTRLCFPFIYPPLRGANFLNQLVNNPFVICKGVRGLSLSLKGLVRVLFEINL